MRFLGKESVEFVNAIHKMRVVIQASGIVISGKKQDRRPDGIEKTQDVKINDSSNMFNPDNLFKDPSPAKEPAGGATASALTT